MHIAPTNNVLSHIPQKAELISLEGDKWLVYRTDTMPQENVTLSKKQYDEHIALGKICGQELAKLDKENTDKILHSLDYIFLGYLTAAARTGFPSASVLSSLCQAAKPPIKIGETTICSYLKLMKNGWILKKQNSSNTYENKDGIDTGAKMEMDNLSKKVYDKYIELGKLCEAERIKLQDCVIPKKRILRSQDERNTKPKRSADELKAIRANMSFKDLITHLTTKYIPIKNGINNNEQELLYSCLSSLQLLIHLHDFFKPEQIHELLATIYTCIKTQNIEPEQTHKLLASIYAFLRGYCKVTGTPDPREAQKN